MLNLISWLETELQRADDYATWASTSIASDVQTAEAYGKAAGLRLALNMAQDMQKAGH
jgi:hypothetical protein